MSLQLWQWPYYWEESYQAVSLQKEKSKYIQFLHKFKFLQSASVF